jgi:hypothetical protein
MNYEEALELAWKKADKGYELAEPLCENMREQHAFVVGYLVAELASRIEKDE